MNADPSPSWSPLVEVGNATHPHRWRPTVRRVARPEPGRNDGDGPHPGQARRCATAHRRVGWGHANLTVGGMCAPDVPGPTRFRRFWTAAAISSFGTALTTVALPVLVVQLLAASAVEVGMVNAAQWLPYAVLGLVAGAYTDRWQRRSVLVWAAIGRVVVLGCVAGLWFAGVLSVWVLVGALLAFGAGSVFGFAASQSLIPHLVPKAGWSERTRGSIRPMPRPRRWARRSAAPWSAPSGHHSRSSSTPSATWPKRSWSRPLPRTTGHRPPPDPGSVRRSATGSAGPIGIASWGPSRSRRTCGSSPRALR